MIGLNIGPGKKDKIPDFQTLDIIVREDIDFITDASQILPFQDNTFDVVYASHILEHIEWHKSQQVLIEWTRILKVGGVMEIWCPDILGMAGQLLMGCDFKWFTFHVYGQDRTGWHKACFTPQYLRELMTNAGLNNVRMLLPEELRGHKYNRPEFGMIGTK